MKNKPTSCNTTNKAITYARKELKRHLPGSQEHASAKVMLDVLLARKKKGS